MYYRWKVSFVGGIGFVKMALALSLKSADWHKFNV
jgi:hypothetical protein